VFVAHWQVNTRAKVRELLAQGYNQLQIARELGVAKSTVAYHARGLGVEPDPRFTRRYDWEVVQAYYDAGHSARECREHFGMATDTWNNARKRGDIVVRAAAMSIEELLASPNRNRNHIKARLIKAGLKEERCEVCGLTEWLGKPISLELHHDNGDGNDNRLENLQVVCGNCHAQTANWGGKNRRLKNGGAALSDSDD
jgi:hypothetical protein